MTDSISRAFKVARRLYISGDYSKSKVLLKKCLQLMESLPQEKLLQLRIAVPVLIQETKLVHPKYAQVLVLLSDCYYHLSNIQKALYALDRLIRSCNWDGTGYLRKSKLLQTINKDKDAYLNFKIGIQNLTHWKQKLREQQTNHFDIDLKFIERLDEYILKMELKKEQIKNKWSQIRQNELVDKNKLTESKSMTKMSTLETIRPKNNNNTNTLKRKFIDPIQEHEEQMVLKKNGFFKVDMIANNINKKRSQFFDILANLPAEILPHVLQHLTVLDLLHLIQCCKRYKVLILQFPQQFSKFNLNSINTKLFNEFIKFLQGLYSGANRSHLKTIDTITFSTKLASEETKLIPKFYNLLQNVRCRTLALSLPNCTTSHLARSMIPNSTFTQSITYLSLKIALRENKEYENNVLNQFNNLRQIELIITSSLIPTRNLSKENKESNVERISKNWSPNLTHLKLLCDKKKNIHLPMSSFWSSDTKYVHLTNIYITGASRISMHLDWLMKFPNLEELWLEDNDYSDLGALLTLFAQKNVFNGNLRKLTFRENTVNRRLDLPADMGRFHFHDNLKNLTHLDLMGTNISARSLVKLLSTISRLKNLNFGDCPFIQLRANFDITDSSFLPADLFFNEISELEELILPQMTYFNDASINYLATHCSKMMSLKKIDLSFNFNITGVSLYDFVVKLYEVRNGKPLDYLLVNGCRDISPVTINMILQRKFVKKIDCIYEKEVWKQFGINSYSYR